MDGTPSLPEEFASLQPFAHWALATETARNRLRIGSRQEEIVAFAEAMLDRVEAIVARLNEFPLHDMPQEWRHLYWMLLSLAEVAPAVEFYRNPTVIEGYDSRRFVADEDFPLRPRY